MYYLYSITNTVNNKRYIGITHDFKHRFYEHRYKLRNGKHHSIKLQRAWDKYGEASFDFSILSTIEGDFLDASQVEIQTIEKYNSYYDGYNASFGGDGTNFAKITDETRAKMSKAMMGNSYGLGKKRTDETRARMSESMKKCKDMEARKKRASEIFKKLWADESFRAKMAELNKGNTYSLGKKMPDSAKRTLSENQLGELNSFYGKRHSKDTKKLLSDMVKERWKDKTYADKVKVGMANSEANKARIERLRVTMRGKRGKISVIDAVRIKYQYACGKKVKDIVKHYPNLTANYIGKICYGSTFSYLPRDKACLHDMLINYQSDEKLLEGLETR